MVSNDMTLFYCIITKHTFKPQNMESYCICSVAHIPDEGEMQTPPVVL